MIMNVPQCNFLDLTASSDSLKILWPSSNIRRVEEAIDENAGALWKWSAVTPVEISPESRDIHYASLSEVKDNVAFLIENLLRVFSIQS